MAEKEFVPVSAPPPKPAPTRVQVTDIDMPFASMVGFMVKWALASIPAIMILFLFVGIGIAVLGGIGAAIHR